MSSLVNSHCAVFFIHPSSLTSMQCQGGRGTQISIAWQTVKKNHMTFFSCMQSFCQDYPICVCFACSRQVLQPSHSPQKPARKVKWKLLVVHRCVCVCVSVNDCLFLSVPNNVATGPECHPAFPCNSLKRLEQTPKPR